MRKPPQVRAGGDVQRGYTSEVRVYQPRNKWQTGLCGLPAHAPGEVGGHPVQGFMLKSPVLPIRTESRTQAQSPALPANPLGSRR